MNREQRRKERSGQKRRCTTGTRFSFSTVPPPIPNLTAKSVPGEADFSAVPLATICQGIQLLIGELGRRGTLVYDFDCKKRAIKQIQILQGKVFFLAEETDHGEI